jgi:hypothetical protein
LPIFATFYWFVVRVVASGGRDDGPFTGHTPSQFDDKSTFSAAERADV